MNKIRNIVVAASCLISILSGAEGRKPAFDFTLKEGKGAVVTLSKYKGKVVLLNFWSASCAPCKVEIPWLMEFADKYKGKGLAVVGVSLDEEGWKLVKPFVEAKKMNYPVVIGGDGLAEQYGVEAMPASFVIDRQGKIAVTKIGLVDKDSFDREIRTLLEAKP